MRAKYIVIGVVVGVLLSATVVLAGSLEPPSGPTDPLSQMYTLEQIYDRLDTGAAVTKMTTFTEPGAGPGTGTMHTLDEIMGLLRSTYTRVPKTGQTGCWNSSGGSISCEDTGQDGEYQLGVLPEQELAFSTTGAYTVYDWAGTRFTDNGDGTVSDNLTGLIWLENANCWGQQNWANALTNSNALADGQCELTDGSGTGDWRLPNVNELHSLIDLTEYDPALPSGHHFVGVQSYYYWSSTTYAYNTSYAWYVRLSSGYVGNDGKTGTYYVWPVRGGQ